MFGKSSKKPVAASQASSSQTPTADDSYVKALRIRVDDGKKIKLLEPGDTYFTCVASCISFGLDLLESRPGRRALERNGEDIIKEVLKKNKDARVRDAAHIHDHVANFLRSVRSNFPCVIVRYLYRQNARTTKGAWDQPPDRAFVAQHAAIIELNAFVITPSALSPRLPHLTTLTYSDLPSQLVTRLAQYLVDWRDKPTSEGRKHRFQTLLFRLGVTMAHEITHIFTSYLLYDRRAHTPPGVSYGPFSSSIVGESGRVWEFRVFGGYMAFRTDGDFEHVGVVKEGGRVKVMTLPAIQSMLRRGKS